MGEAIGASRLRQGSEDSPERNIPRPEREGNARVPIGPGGWEFVQVGAQKGRFMGSTVAPMKDVAKRLYMLMASGASSCLTLPSVV